MTESWAGMDVPPAVTTYSVTTESSGQLKQTVYPDGSHLTQFVYVGGPFSGLMYKQIISDQRYPHVSDDHNVGEGGLQLARR